MTKPMSEAQIEIYKKYQNKWVALNEAADEVITSGKDIKEVVKKLRKGNKSAFELRFIPELGKLYA